MGIISKKGFKDAIKEYTRDNDWDVTELETDHGVIDFETEDGEEYTLYLDCDEESLIFSIPSQASFESEESIDHKLSTLLLQRNAALAMGYWSLEDIEGEWYFVIYHTHMLPNKDFDLDLDSDTFASIVEELIGECAEFNQIWNEEE